MLTVFASCIGAFVASCAPDDSVRPKYLPPQVQVEVAVPDGCARFQVAANPGQAAVVDTVYNTGACALDQLKIMQDSAATFDATTGTLRVAVVIKNIGTQTVRVPTRLRFNADSTRMLDANNETVPGPSDILGYLADSVSTTGRIFYWRFDTLLATGAFQVLAPNATSKRRWIEFRGTDWDKKVRLKLFTAGRYGTPVPATPPDTMATWIGVDSNLVRNRPGFPASFSRNVVLIQFSASATQADKQSAVDAIDGDVIGAESVPGTGGLYAVRVPSSLLGDGVFAAMTALPVSAVVLAVVPAFGPGIHDQWIKPHVAYIARGGTLRFKYPNGNSVDAPLRTGQCWNSRDHSRTRWKRWDRTRWW